MNKQWRIYILATCAWVLAFICALKFGAAGDVDLSVIVQLRLPRAILAAAVGAGLALSGAVLQAVFANPLCDPYTLGISSGAALGAVAANMLGVHGVFSGIALSAFAGAVVFTGFLYMISLRSRGSMLTLLLGGVMLGYLGSSLVALWMALGDVNGVQGAMMWLLGDLSRARLPGALMTLASVLTLGFVLWRRWRVMDALLMGEDDAQGLGVPVQQERRRLVLLVSFLIAVCVSAAGMIGFIGLVVPHFARRSVGSLHLQLIPLVALLGAAVLTASDLFSRVVASPYELPVGVVTALIGAPMFLWIMLDKYRGRHS